MKVLILGINPSTRNGRSKSLAVLYSWMDQLKLGTVSFCNINPNTGEFRLEDTQKEYVQTICRGYDRVIALGNVVSRTLQSLDINHFKLPHPSGFNRQLNDPTFVNDQLSKCQLYLTPNQVLQ